MGVGVGSSDTKWAHEGPVIDNLFRIFTEQHKKILLCRCIFGHVVWEFSEWHIGCKMDTWGCFDGRLDRYERQSLKWRDHAVADYKQGQVMLQQENVLAFAGCNTCPTWTLKINLRRQCTLIFIFSVSNSNKSEQNYLSVENFKRFLLNNQSSSRCQIQWMI